MSKKKVAFICVHNSCRSQIAEAFGKHLASDVFESYSAGTETKPQINQDAVRIMKESYGIDMEADGQYSKLIRDIPTPDIVISMGCNVGCPFIDRPFDSDTDFTMVHPDDVAKVKALLSTIGDNSDEIDDFVIRFKDKNDNYRWVRWMGRLIRGRLGTPQAFLGKISDVQNEMTREQDLREKASVDGLTGALNRKAAEQKINTLMQDKECKGYLLMLDIDDFKTVNDTMGHAIGDLALITLVKLLKEHFRREDIVGRLGGDEFIVFMTNTELASAVEAKGAEILDILAKSETTPHFTVSIGAAAYPAAGNDYESLYLAADNAMYASKKSGKNRIYVDNGQQKKE